MNDDRTLTGFLTTYVVPEEETATFDLTDPAGPMMCRILVKDGDRTAVLNIVRAGGHLSVDVRGYVGEAEHDSRVIGWGPRGSGTFVPGTFPLATVVVAETERPAGLKSTRENGA